MCRVNTPRKQGGLGSDLKLTLLADKNMKISTDYGVLIDGAGIALRYVCDVFSTIRPFLTQRMHTCIIHSL